MDFGKILDKWEKGKEPGSIKELLSDKETETENKAAKQAEQRRRLRTKKPDDVIDIHGQTSEEAWISLDRFFDNAKSLSYEKLLIIHGKGNHSNGDAVLSRTVRSYIEQCPIAGESGHERAAGGGSGATWVLLKQTEKSVT